MIKKKGSLPTAERLTCSPSMASRSMLGVSLDACLKVKLLQSMMRMKPLTCSSGSSIIDSSDSRIALSMSTNVYLGKGERKISKKMLIFTISCRCIVCRLIRNNRDNSHWMHGILWLVGIQTYRTYSLLPLSHNDLVTRRTSITLKNQWPNGSFSISSENQRESKGESLINQKHVNSELKVRKMAKIRRK